VLHFVAYLARPSRRPRPLKASSIASYISALSWAESWHGHNTLNAHARKLVKSSLRGLQRLVPQAPNRKLPITLSILRKCSTLITSHPSSLTVWSAMLTAFFGLLRCGEFTSQSRNHITPTRREDLTFHETYTKLFLRTSKTDQVGNGCFVYLPKLSGDSLCPYSSLLQMVRATPHAINLFEINGLPLTRSDFIDAVRALLTAAGIPQPMSFAGHSFRRGGATAASEAGLPDHAIQKLGRWTSACFRLYIQTSPHLLLSFAQQLIQSNPLGGASN
jgi:hypothetical protein